jgi:hypothetical protein
MDDTGQGQDPAEFPTNTTGNGSKQPSPEEEQISAAGPNTVEPSAHLSDRKFTGPRTPEGKEISKHNAVRHGIFSEVTVLPGESSDEFESLLNGLSEALRPENGLEKLLVEKLAMIAWRHRRLLQAEGAEIQQGSEFVEWDQRMQQSLEAETASRTIALIQKTRPNRPGLISNIQNSEILARCVELLLDLEQKLKSRGFNQDNDRVILNTIYGTGAYSSASLRNRYFELLITSELPEEERQRRNYMTPERCKDRMLSDIDAEIRRLLDYQKEQTRNESERTKLEIQRRKVPESTKLDRLLRYEASLERAFDRALNQLERLQRLRRGQPVAPRIDVTFSP